MKNPIKIIFKFSNTVRVVILNTLFWAIIIGLIAFTINNISSVERGKTLFIQPGIISDSGVDVDLLSMIMSGDTKLPDYTLLSDILRSIELAENDNAIDNIVLDLDYIGSVGYGSAEEIGQALTQFKKSGKSVYAYSSYYSQGSYYLASYANEISMDPYGELSINGIEIYRNYWKNFLDRYNVDVSVFRAGEYKSYVEPYISDGMSEVVKNQNLVWMNSIWDGFIEQIRKNRSMELDFIENYFSERVDLLKQYDGDVALFAEGSGFVDYLETRDQFFNKFSSFYSMDNYLAAHMELPSKNSVGILNIEGTITYNDNNPGSVSAVEIINILDDYITGKSKGLIVRINSGGGSVYASELIRRKVAEAALYMPVIVSMGDVCASGGYWIATAGDTILSDKRTITGSIGVFGMLFGFEESLEEHFGIKNDGVSTTKYSNNLYLTKNISAEQSEIFQLSVDNTYDKFLKLVSISRSMDIKDVDSIAQGRVWSGEQALELQLTDEIGGLNSAKNILREKLGEKTTFEVLQGVPGIGATLLKGISGSNIFNQIPVVHELTIFERINDPKNIYAMWY